MPGAPQERWFAGTIGSGGGRMHLMWLGGVVKGEFYRFNDWKPVFVGGKMLTHGSLLLHEEDGDDCDQDDCPGPGRLRAQFTATALAGSWQPSTNGQAETIRMRAERTPSCAGAGSQRVFRDPAWPVTFSYPASWHLDAEPNTITLLCPDPDWMAHDDWNVSLIQGTIGPDGKLPDEAGFSRDAKGNWEYEAVLAGDPVPVPVVERNGLTIVLGPDGSSERGYCRIGGYSGIEDDTDVLVVLGRHWIRVSGGTPAEDAVERLVKTIALRRGSP